MKPFAKAVQQELNRARAKHPTPQHSAHEGYAGLREEVDEFWDEVKSQKQDRLRMLEELIQIGAMAQRTAEDLGLIDDTTNA
jgi:NTP pyrophosphatase (non-canonical NTP hydrolase)